jgi:hypothetical protein
MRVDVSGGLFIRWDSLFLAPPGHLGRWAISLTALLLLRQFPGPAMEWVGGTLLTLVYRLFFFCPPSL